MANMIGEFLINIGALTQEQVDVIVHRQEEGDMRMFGEIGLDLGFLTDDSIKRYADHMERWNLTAARRPPSDT